MTDRNELRRLAEACLAHLDSGPLWVEWEENGPGPVEFLVLLDEIERLEGECDFFSARSEEERTNRGLAETDFHDAMELVRQYSAERDQLREEAKQALVIVGNVGRELGQTQHERDQLRAEVEAGRALDQWDINRTHSAEGEDHG